MVTVIGSGTSIRRSFSYNENKVKEGVAECLMAANYPLDLDQMDGHQRLQMLLNTAALNPDVSRSSIHISLNFAPGEQLSDDQLRQISSEYMQQIGFAGQPFLVYRHDDAAHPHVHIVTTKIRPDGSRIDTQNIGKLKSEPARKDIEQRFGLVKAEDQKQHLYELKPVNPTRIIYGQQPTKKAIAGVLQNVLQGYKYTSLAELNAVLRQYNIEADRGSEQSRVFSHHGLLYHALNTDGNRIGVPVKASSFYNSPGLRYLDKQFLKNDVARQPYKDRLKSTIDLILLRNPKISLDQFATKLKAEGIHLEIRTSAEGLAYGLTYIDHRTKCVFNGSAVGKNYSAKSITERLSASVTARAAEMKTPLAPGTPKKNTPGVNLPQHPESTADHNTDQGLLEQLLDYENSPQQLPFGWKRKKKRKKKR